MMKYEGTSVSSNMKKKTMRSSERKLPITAASSRRIQAK
jgi:hypothetical protein